MKELFRLYHKNSILVQVLIILILTCLIYFGAYYQGG
jgi:hypothetical protein